MNDLKKQARFLKYILGLRPDEFGLVPDRDGYVKIKDLLKAVHEEAGWRSFRQANINEMMLSLAPAQIAVYLSATESVTRDNGKRNSSHGAQACDPLI